ncbi:MAG: alpha-hydroxy-acid oxidizing protein [Nitrospinota bacterium]|nr:alpha-hydroxy-acid oxidizing protein [Nitrospinota bacterium]
MKKQKTIMIIGGGVMQIPAIKEAFEMGLKVIVVDYNPDSEGIKMAHFPLLVSTRNIDMAVMKAREFHNRHPVDGVITVGTDASKTVAAVANALKLPGIRFEVAERATNKIKMRQRLRKKGVPVPDFYGVWNLDEAKEAMEKLGLPLVIKPADNMGARGVRSVSVREELIEAFYSAKDASISGEIILEDFMEGPELSIDAIVIEKEIFITGVADRIIEMPPYFIETGHIMPSALSKKEIDAACRVMCDGIRALGIDTGTAKGDIKITPDGVAKVGEIAARLSGGFMSSYTFPLATGVNLLQAAIKIAIGENSIDLTHKFKKCAIERAIIPKPGKILSIEGLDRAGKIKGVAEIIMHKSVGDIMYEQTSNMDKAGNVIVVGSSREEALETSQKVLDTIKISVDSSPEISLEKIRNNARKKFALACRVCKVCDGVECAGEMPGMGGVGTGSSFTANLVSLAQYQIRTKMIHSVKCPDTSINVLGLPLSVPVFAAPITGTITNMGGGVDELEYAEAVIEGCQVSGSIGMVGDGAEPEKYKVGLQAIKKNRGWGIPVFKPREFNQEIIKRIHAAEKAGAKAVGIDIDAVSLKTMELKKQPVGPKTVKDLKEIIKETSLPFILKGIMTPDDAIFAVESGADAIVVSNHGGRVMDFMPGFAEVLPSIVRAVKGEITILADGGIRTGIDILKAIALGAEAVLIGRPIAISAVGEGKDGVAFIFRTMIEEFKRAMVMTGCGSIKDIDSKIIFKK